MAKDWDNVCVSYYRNVMDTSPGRIKLSVWLGGSQRYEHLVKMIRAENDKGARRSLKLRLPCITPSGIFGGTCDLDLIEHSGFIGIDIDDIPPIEAKHKLSMIPWIYYAGLSVSGRGVWALVPIMHPDKHREHFLVIKKDLAEHGLVIDPSCANVARKRFYSSDTDPMINKAADVYDRLEAQLMIEPVQLSGTEYNKAKMLLSRIRQTHTDITQTYNDWLLVGGALASMFGEDGRWMFHQISCYHEKYNRDDADTQYNRCLKNKKNFGVGILFSVAAKYGVYAAG